MCGICGIVEVFHTKTVPEFVAAVTQSFTLEFVRNMKRYETVTTSVCRFYHGCRAKCLSLMPSLSLLISQWIPRRLAQYLVIRLTPMAHEPRMEKLMSSARAAWSPTFHPSRTLMPETCERQNILSVVVENACVDVNHLFRIGMYRQ